MRTLLLVLVANAVPVLANVPENLDRAAISEGITKVRPKIQACGSSSSASGIVKVKVQVAPDGSVATASTQSSPDPALGNCVVGVLKTATFRKTVNGGSFSYPFVFGSATRSPSTGDTLDRAAISDGIAKVKPDVHACGKTSSAKGTVKVKVDVAPAGNVTNADVTTTPDQALGTCVADAIKKATFKKTAKGGSFSYPFAF